MEDHYLLLQCKNDGLQIIFDGNEGVHISMAPWPEEGVWAGKHPIAHIGACSFKEKEVLYCCQLFCGDSLPSFALKHLALALPYHDHRSLIVMDRE
jgi:hypothetical protein